MTKWNEDGYCTPAEREAARLLAGENADVMTVSAGQDPVRIWTPDGVRLLVPDGEKPLWASFVEFVQKAVPRHDETPAA